jgi:hypothetical protein
METAAPGLAERAKSLLRPSYRKRGVVYFLYRSSWDHSYPFLCIHSAYWQLRAAITGEALVHFIGDSHTTAFNFGRRFIVHHVGQATAHNLVKENSSSSSREILFRVLSGINRKRDIVAMVFGEIDCRVHFHYQYMKQGRKTSISSLIDRTILNYGFVLCQIRQMGFVVAVVGVPPAARQKNIYGYPFYGSPQQRSRISRMFNSKLRAFCKSNGFPYLDVYSASSDSNGFILPAFARDEVHLNKRIAPEVSAQLSNQLRIRF